MMDLKEIIRWFIPCFHIRLVNKRKMRGQWIVFSLFLLFLNSCVALKLTSASDVGLRENSNLEAKYDTFSVGESILNQSAKLEEHNARNYADLTVGRTFGRPFKKMIAALIPLVFQIGAASTWAVVAALVGVKTLLVTVAILKLLLIAGAVKMGALFGSKGHHQHWEPPPHQNKEIHLHIHNGQHQEHHEEYGAGPWSRDGVQDLKPVSIPVPIVFDPLRGGPQTISTPYGNYVKVNT